MRRLFDFLASMKLAVVLLVALAAAMAVGTIIETRQDAIAARHFVYGAAWFNWLIGLLAINVLFVTLKRWPWQRRHIGFLVTHLGIIVLLVGALFSRLYGVEGKLELAEGASKAVLELEGEAVQVKLADNPHTFQLEHGASGSLAGRLPLSEQLPGTDVEVALASLLPHAAPSEEVIEGTGEFNPAITYQFSGEMTGTLDGWLMPSSAAHNVADLGPLKVRFRVVSSSAELAQYTQPSGGAAAHYGMLEVTLPGLPPQEFDVQELLHAPAEVMGSTWSVKVLDYLPDAKVSRGKLVNDTDQPNNPAVVAELISPSGATEEHKAFAKFPDFSTMHGKQAAQSGAKLVFKFDATQSSEGKELQVLLANRQDLLAVLPAAEGAPKILPLKPGEPIDTPWEGLKFAVTKFYPRAATTEGWAAREEGEGVPALQVKVKVAGQEGHALVPWDQPPTTIEAGNGKVLVKYGPPLLDLGFTVKLLKFESPNYGGTTMAARYFSKVEISGAEGAAAPTEHIISMNQPLDMNGFRIFQSGYDRGHEGRTVSIFSVSRDPGVPVVYAGCGVLMLGLALIFYLPKGRAG